MGNQGLKKQIDQINTISVEGLEDFFVENNEGTVDAGLSMKEAAHYYNDSTKNIRAKIRTGEIAAIRVVDGDRRKWRIYPAGIPDSLVSHLGTDEIESQIEIDSEFDGEAVQSQEVFVQVIDQKPENLETLPPNDELSLVGHLKGRIADLENKLQAEIFRNGYLEAQLEVLEGKYKFIGLLETKTPWWRRLLNFYGIS